MLIILAILKHKLVNIYLDILEYCTKKKRHSKRTIISEY